MNESVDNQVVKMTFDHEQFSRGIKDTIKSLESLEKALGLEGATDGLEEIASAAPETAKSIDNIGDSVDRIEKKFSTLQVVGYSALFRLTNMAVSTGVKMANAIWGPISQGGMNRALNIENAKFQLQGLGVAWQSVSGIINDAVSGTAYGLDAAAKIASQLIASGLQIGDDLQTALDGISNVAAMTNSTYEDIGGIYATIKANNRLMTEQLRQFSYRGLNVTAKLGEYLGKTEQEISQMVSKGLIDFDTFSTAMLKEFEGHAKGANDTFQGAMSNFRAALSRTGAMFAEPRLKAFTKMLNSLRLMINEINEALKPVANYYGYIMNMIATSLGKLQESGKVTTVIQSGIKAVYSWIRAIAYALYRVTLYGTQLGDSSKTLVDYFGSLELTGERFYKVSQIFFNLFNVLKTGLIIIQNIGKVLTPILNFATQLLLRILGLTGVMANNLGDIYDPINNCVVSLGDLIALKLDKFLTTILNILDSINFTAIVKALSLIGKGMAFVVVNAVRLAGILAAVIIWVFKNIPKVIDLFVTIKNKIVEATKAVKDFFTEFTSTRMPVLRFDFDTSAARQGIQSAVTYARRLFDNGTSAVNTNQAPAVSANGVTVSGAGTGSMMGQMASVTGLTEPLNNLSTAMISVEKSSGRMDRALTSSISKMRRGGKAVSDVIDTITEKAGKSGSALTRMKEDYSIALSEKDLQSKSDVAAVVKSTSFASGIQNKVENMLEKSKLAPIYEAIKNFASTVKDKATDLIKNFNPMKAIFAALGALVILLVVQVIKIITSVVSMITVIPSLIKGIANTFGAIGNVALAKKYNAVFKVILSIAAIIGVIALVSQLCDLQKLDDALGILMKYSLKLIKALFPIILIVSFVDTLTSISRILSKITGGKPIVNPYLSLAKVLPAIGISIASIAATLLLFSKTMPTDEFSRTIKMFEKIMIDVSLFIGFLSFVMNMFKMFDTFTTTVSILDKKTADNARFLERINPMINSNSRSASGSLTSIMISVIGLLIGVSHALNMISDIPKNKIDKGISAFKSILITVGAFIGVITLLAGDYAKNTNNLINSPDLKYYSDARSKTNNARVMGAIHGIINAITIFTLIISASLSMLSKVPSETLKSATTSLVDVLSVVLVSISLMIAVIGQYSSTLDIKKISKLASVEKQIRKTFVSISVLMISISVSLMMLSSISSLNLDKYSGLIPAVVTLSTLVLVLFGAIGSFIKMIQRKAIDGDIIDIALGKISKVMWSLIPMISSIIASIVILSRIPGFNKSTYSGLGPSLLAMTAILIMVSKFASSMIAISNVIGLTTITKLNSIALTITSFFAGLSILSLALAKVSKIGISFDSVSTIMYVLLNITSLFGLMILASKTMTVRNTAGLVNMSIAFAILSSTMLSIGLVVATLSKIKVQNLYSSVGIILGVLFVMTIITTLSAVIASNVHVLTSTISVMTSMALFVTTFIGSISVFIMAIGSITENGASRIERLLPELTIITMTITACVSLLIYISSVFVSAAPVISTLSGLIISMGASIALLGVGLSIIENIHFEYVLTNFIKGLAEAGNVIKDNAALIIYALGTLVVIGIVMSFAIGRFTASLKEIAITLGIIASVIIVSIVASAFGIKYAMDVVIDSIYELQAKATELASGDQGALFGSIVYLSLLFTAMTALGVLMVAAGATTAIGGALLNIGMIALLNTLDILSIISGKLDIVDPLQMLSIIKNLGLVLLEYAVVGIAMAATALVLSIGTALFSISMLSFDGVLGILETVMVRMDNLNKGQKLLKAIGWIGASMAALAVLGGLMSLAALSMSIGSVGLLVATGPILLALGAMTLLGTAFIAVKDIIVEAVGDFINNVVNAITSFVDTIGGIVGSVTDAVGGFVSGVGNFFGGIFDTGVSIADGLIQGATAGIQGGGAMLANMLNDEFREEEGIHSPSTVFAKFGDFLMQGLSNGIEWASPYVKSALGKIQNGMGGFFNDQILPFMERMGLNGGHAFGIGMAKGVNDVWKEFGDQYGARLRTIEAQLPFKQKLLDQYIAAWSSLTEDEKRDQRLLDGKHVVIGGVPMTWQELSGKMAALKAEVEAMTASKSELETILANMVTLATGQTQEGLTVPVIDTSQFTVDTSGIASSISGASGAGSGINDTSRIGSGNNINSNNTYNFIQNNYSPEPLERTELYRQTRSQLNDFYGAMGY